MISIPLPASFAGKIDANIFPDDAGGWYIHARDHQGSRYAVVTTRGVSESGSGYVVMCPGKPRVFGNPSHYSQVDVWFDLENRYFAVACRHGNVRKSPRQVPTSRWHQNDVSHRFVLYLLRAAFPSGAGVYVGDSVRGRLTLLDVPDAQTACVSADGATVLVLDAKLEVAMIFDNPLV